MEGKFIYLIFIAIYFYLQYRAAQKKKQQELSKEHKEPQTDSGKGRGFKTLEDILKETQRQFQETKPKKHTQTQPLSNPDKKEKIRTPNTYESIADKHNETKSAYTPLTNNESFTGEEGQSVFAHAYQEQAQPDQHQGLITPPITDLRQAIIAEAILNRPYA